MTTEARPRAARPGILRRVATAACPGPGRLWVDAMFAELDAIEGALQRFAWGTGMVSVVLSVLETRAANLLSVRHRSAIALSLLAAGLSCVGWLAGYEGLGIDDDVFSALAVASSAVALLLGAAAVSRMFGEPGVLPTGRR